MPGFNLFSLLKTLNSTMITTGSTYRFRRARQLVRSTRPALKGPSRLSAVWQEITQRNEPAPPDPATYLAPGHVKDAAVNHPTATLIMERGALQFTSLADDLFLLRIRPEAHFDPPRSYSIAKAPEQWQNAPPLEKFAEAITVTTPVATVQLKADDGHLTLSTAAGDELLHAIPATSHPDGWVYWEAQVNAGAAVYGLGEKAFALNLAGRTYELWNTDPAGYYRGFDPINLSVPFTIVHTEQGTIGLFFDNSYRSWIDCAETASDTIAYRAMGGEFRLYLFTGTPRSIVERYTELTGRSIFPPLWVLGFHQSRWSYETETRVREIANELRQRNLPADAIHIDIDYMDGYRCFTWDNKKFPQPAQMLSDLHDQGFKIINIIDPGIKVDKRYHVYEDGLKRDAFISYPDGTPYVGPVWPGNCHFPDFSNTVVREWWGNLYQPFLDAGVDAFWNDMNEIALIVMPPDVGNTIPDELIHDGNGHTTNHAEIHNVYGMLMVRASMEGLQRLQPDKRPLVITRAGWAGVQRYAMHWTADNGSSWDHLLLSFQMVMNLGLSGIPITGPDVGGFGDDCTPELLARWMAAGAFMPFYRNHAMKHTLDQEPWAFGPEVEAISRKYLELRYQLLPYIYTTTWQAVQQGTPVLRPLVYMHPDDPQIFSLDDQFYLGDWLLVAPVVESDVDQRLVYLPAGGWYDYWTGTYYEGGQTITANAPLDVVPLYVRAGGVIPHWPIQQYIGEKVIDTVTLHVYSAPGEHRSLLYEDDGETPDYDDPSQHRLSTFTSSDGLTLVRTVSGEYPSPVHQFNVRIIGVEQSTAHAEIDGGTILSALAPDETGYPSVTIQSDGAFTLRLQ